MPRCLVLLASLALFLPSPAAAQELERPASWQPAKTAEVKARLTEYLAAGPLDEAARQKILALWPADDAVLDGAELLNRLAASLALASAEARAVVEFCSGPSHDGELPKFPILGDDKTPAWLRDNLRLLLGKWLVQHELMDEGREQLAGLQPAAVVDPAGLLFHQALAHHRLLEKTACLAAVTKLLEQEAAIPRRYAKLAKLMEADVKPLQPDSLDEVARLMEDIRRRLGLGRAGKKVRDEEDEVIAKLEKMIDDLEKQRQQQQQQQSPGSGGPSARPAEKSSLPAMNAKGEVDPKNIGKKDGWGNLPPKQRQEVLQQIGRELPAHYRETIEEYFKRLAQDGVK